MLLNESIYELMVDGFSSTNNNAISAYFQGQINKRGALFGRKVCGWVYTQDQNERPNVNDRFLFNFVKY